ncbi:MAG: fatty acid desaturase [Rhizobiales bacterium]|nr:fatty acid desaturase [Hyphomicrobiales bacterium]
MTDKFDPASRAEPGDARRWPKLLAAFREPDEVRSVVEILVTALPFAGFWVVMWWLVSTGHWWLALFFTVPAAAFLVRLFMIQHDCGHDAFFRSRAVNGWVGRIIGVATFTPYDYWRRTHAVHHAGSGNLDQRGMGDVTTLTVEEYRASGFWGRVGYRAYRHPLVMFGIGPAYLFLLQYRLPIGLMREGWRPWASAMGTNLAIIAVAAFLIWLVGLGPFLMIQLPIVAVAGSIGVWLFYVQHQFEGTFWARPPEWTHQEAALHGSSYYVLPGFLRWMTANIGLHHIHHLASRIPYYNLPKVLRTHPELGSIGRVTLSDSLRTVRLVLWDERRRQMVPFKGWRRWSAAAAPQAS